MKILIYACHFTPDPIGVGKFTGEMAEWLAAQGHEVRAVVAVPFYPHWRVSGKYSAWRYTRETVAGVEIVRCPIWVPQRQSGIARILQYLTLAISSSPVLLWWALRWRPQIVWTVMPPMTGFPIALAAAWLARARSWLHVQDFEVDAAFELGILKSDRSRALLSGLERRLMSAFDVVSSITPKMVERLAGKRIRTRRHLFPNWADVDAIYPLGRESALRAELKIAPGRIVALYSGSLGEKQGVEDLILVARLLVDHREIQFVICGDGVGRARLAMLAGEGLPNTHFLPVQPIERLNELLNLADIHLLPQKSEISDFVMPSKLGGMLASGRPIIASAHSGTQLAQEVSGAGIVVPPGDVGTMAAAIMELSGMPERRAELGAEAARRAQQHWKKTSILHLVEGEMQAMIESSKVHTDAVP